MSDVDTARPANEERGELSLILAGVPMVLRPTFEALNQIEVVTNRGLVELARDGIAGRLKLGEVAQVTTECVRAWGREVNDTGAAGANAVRIGKLIIDSPGGLHAAMKTVAAMLSLAITGGYTSEGEVKLSTTTMTTEPAPVDS